MDFNKTVDLIIRDLEEAREIIDDLKNYREVPAIQIEMAKSKIRNASEVISLFKSLKPEDRSARAESPLPSERQKTEDHSARAESPLRSESPTPDARRPMPSYEETKHEPEIKNISDASILADRFSDLHDSLNEAIGFDNLSKAIGVNDRFLFIRELFDGNSDSYNHAILKIDEAQSFSDARALMITLAGDKSESEAGKQLLDLVKRKFPGNE